ncbi:MAG: OmpA family protein [Sphingomonas sp.]|nr:MAG: OmpA family protein [Sphingomonas sp.]
MSLRMLTFPVVILGFATAGYAQEAKTPSVEGYLCTFAGKCGSGDALPVATRAAPNTKGFRLAKPTSPTDSKSVALRSPASQPRALVRPPVQAQRHYGQVTRRANYGAGTAMAGAAGVGAVGVARPRADLMIGFERNSAQLTAEGTRAAQVFAKSLLMPELTGKRFLIEGHTDLRGGPGINVPLSAARAKAVADYLVILGVDNKRLEVRGYGASAPLPGHAKSDPVNRRVEAELIS